MNEKLTRFNNFPNTVSRETKYRRRKIFQILHRRNFDFSNRKYKNEKCFTGNKK